MAEGNSGELPPSRRTQPKLKMSEEAKLLSEGFNNFVKTMTEAPVTGLLIGIEENHPSRDTTSQWLRKFVEACELFNRVDHTKLRRFLQRCFYLSSGPSKQW